MQLEKSHESSPWGDLRPESPALGAEQFRVPNQTGKEPQGA